MDHVEGSSNVLDQIYADADRRGENSDLANKMASGEQEPEQSSIKVIDAERPHEGDTK